jgi:ubiquinone/menaquinone biosynthesis C-methylase UbiE
MAQTSGWQLSGKAPESWERYLVGSAMESWARDLVHRAGLRPGDRVLDVACGSGIVARTANEHVRWNGKVTGVDINPGMLSVARQVTAYTNPPIEFVEGNAVELPFKDNSFDKVFCQFSAQFFPDRVAAFRQMLRVTAPGGRAFVSTPRGINHNVVYKPFLASLEKHISKEAAEIFGSVFNVSDASMLRTPFEQAGWKDVHIEIRNDTIRYPSAKDFVRWEFESMPTPALWQKFGETGEAIAEDLQRALADHIDDNGIVLPFQGWIVEARKA